MARRKDRGPTRERRARRAKCKKGSGKRPGVTDYGTVAQTSSLRFRRFLDCGLHGLRGASESSLRFGIGDTAGLETCYGRGARAGRGAGFRSAKTATAARAGMERRYSQVWHRPGNQFKLLSSYGHSYPAIW